MIIVQPPLKIDTPNLVKERSRLDKIREDMRISIPKLDSLLRNALGSQAPNKAIEMNQEQIKHVIRYLKRNESKLWLERQNGK